jgi:hypothetical protein
MTLKEKFRKLNLSTWINENDTEKIEQIADEFAIGFGCWLHQNLTHISKDSWGVYNGEWLTVNESLEIYKKEKGL